MFSLEENLNELGRVLGSLRDLEPELHEAANRCIAALECGGKLLVCGNGGSAAEAQHLTGELVGRYKESRPELAAVTLAADAAVLTCIGNDYSFEDVFSGKCRRWAGPGMFW